MHKQVGAISLVAGTCIGSGMIALPMVLAKLGILPSIFVMLVIWFVSYYTSLIHLELNLKVGTGKDLGALGRIFSGPIAEGIGIGSIKILSYALLAVYIYGGASVLQKLLEFSWGQGYKLSIIATFYALVCALLLTLPIRLIDYINRLLFLCLLGIVFILVAGLVTMICWADLPWVSMSYYDLSAWKIVIPVLFGAFGFQVIFHTLTNYCNKDAIMLKRAFLWGSFIPALVYIIWTCSVLSVVHHENPTFYHQMALGKIEVGELISQLSHIAQWKSVQMLVWWISLLAIITSVLGVGLGLCDSFKNMMHKRVVHPLNRNVLASIVTIFPAYFVALFVPNAFISVLGFAGMILVVIAILLPAYLFYKAKISQLHYPELKIKTLMVGSIVVGLLIMICEILNMFMW